MLLVITGISAVFLQLQLASDASILAGATVALAGNLVLEARSATAQQQYALVPFVDLANHAANINAEVQYEYFKDGFGVDAGQCFAPGDEFVISYGRQTVDSALQFYGFVDASVHARANDVHKFADAAATLRQHADPARLQDVAESIEPLALTAEAQLSDEAKAALRYATGGCASLAEGGGGGARTADARMWQAVVALVRRDCAAFKRGPAEASGSGKKHGKAQGEARRLLVQRYLEAKHEMLLACDERLQQRIEKLQGM